MRAFRSWARPFHHFRALSEDLAGQRGADRCLAGPGSATGRRPEPFPARPHKGAPRVAHGASDAGAGGRGVAVRAAADLIERAHSLTPCASLSTTDTAQPFYAFTSSISWFNVRPFFGSFTLDCGRIILAPLSY